MTCSHIWTQSCEYNDANKRAFHRAARERLHSLAQALQLAPNSYDIRCNRGGPAVSGEIILHHEQLYICINQPPCGIAMGLGWRDVGVFMAEETSSSR